MPSPPLTLAVRALKMLGLAPRRPVREETSDPGLQAKWLAVRTEYFPERTDLDQFTIRWSRRRQRRVLASCSLRRRLVSVAKEMRHAQAAPHLDALLYHEMCHAALGEAVGQRGGKRTWHGPRFRALESRHPGSDDLDRWIRGGGWAHVVRSNRASAAAQRRLGKRKNPSVEKDI